MMDMFLGCRGASTLTINQWAANTTAVRSLVSCVNWPKRRQSGTRSNVRIIYRMSWCVHAPGEDALVRGSVLATYIT